MQNINSTKDLKEAIRLLEIEQSIKGELLRSEFHQIYESIKPANLIKATLNDLVSSSDLGNNVLTSAVGYGSGYLSKKIVVGTSKNPFRKLLGLAIQIGVSSFVSQHSETIKSIGQFLLQSVVQKKNENPS
ncbi:MAG: hypothetical protein PHU27_12445, partial [Salinivirgaceae bacterium]|nr:hypothetical protein [Salinivirgaceae bacterium]MDD4748008.1 hypothetical protein [Salinivirgaceae bacterium]